MQIPNMAGRKPKGKADGDEDKSARSRGSKAASSRFAAQPCRLHGSDF